MVNQQPMRGVRFGGGVCEAVIASGGCHRERRVIPRERSDRGIFSPGGRTRPGRIPRAALLGMTAPLG